MSLIRVLIVEDDPMVAEINKKFTEAVEGFAVVGVARNGQEALAFMGKKAVDLLILDIYLPDKNGVEILSKLRRDEQPVDVIMVTAADDSKTVSKVLRQGVVAYIAKPFKFDRYRSVLEAYRNFRDKTQRKASLAQEDIDGILAIQQSVVTEETPKNFNAQTLSLITNYLHVQEQFLSAEEIALAVGLSRVTVRRYLEYLVDQGRVQRVMDYHAVGRPIHRFRLLK